MKRIALLAATLLCTAGFTTPALGATYIVDYSWNAANLFQITLEGTAAATGTRVTVSSITALTHNGIAIAGPLSVISTDASYGFSTAKPIFSTDGSYLDFSVYKEVGQDTEQLSFQVGNTWSRLVGNSVGLTAGWGGNDNVRRFDKANFKVSLVPLPAVPEPTTWAMLLVGFGVTGAALRYRRRRISVAYA